MNRIKMWIKVLGARKPLRYSINNLFFSSPQFLIYQKAASLYFSDKYQDSEQREAIIKEWEDIVK